jgi:hypothetical protein
LLSTHLRTGVLGAGLSYSATVTISIPDAIAGNFSFIVVTDVFDSVYEHTNEEDNVLASMVHASISCLICLSMNLYSPLQPPISVILAPPPDLLVLSLLVADMYSSGDSMIITYTVENAGAGDPFERYWTDQLVS